MDLDKIHLRTAQAEDALNAQRRRVDHIQSAHVTSEALAKYANDLAEAEGKTHAWLRLEHGVASIQRQGAEATKEEVLEIGLELLLAGADDTWSGRGNDVRRARFDGIRAAVGEFRWL